MTSLYALAAKINFSKSNMNFPRAMVWFAGAVALCLSAAMAHAEKRVALVVGNSAYVSVARLPNPVTDATAVADLFRKAGFEAVQLRLDLSISEFRHAIGDFMEVATDSDVAVIYYAGHGMEIDGTNYLVPVDAKLARDFDVEDEALPLDRLLRAIEPARRLRLVILDACRDNPFLRTMKRSVASRAIGRGLAKIEPTTSDTLIAFAARAGSTALDGDGPNSPFTEALLKHVATPGLDIRIAFGRVRDDVLRHTRQGQEPFVYGSLGGETVSLVEMASVRPATDELTSPVDEAAQAWAAAKDTTSVEVLEAFIHRYDRSVFSELARARLRELKQSTENNKDKIVDWPAGANGGTDPTRTGPNNPASDKRASREQVPNRQEPKHTEKVSAGAAAAKCHHWLVCTTCNNPAWLNALYKSCVQRCLSRGLGQCA
jgi:uncharacterized caspase-like protein